MDQEPILENENDLNKRVESEPSKLELQGAEILENPTDGDFIAGLRGFIDWVKTLVAKND